MLKGGAARGKVHTAASPGLGAASGGEDMRPKTRVQCGADVDRGHEVRVSSDGARRGRGADSEEGDRGAGAKDRGRGGNAKSADFACPATPPPPATDATGVFGDARQRKGRSVERQASSGKIGETRGAGGYAEREFCIDNLLILIHLILEMI